MANYSDDLGQTHIIGSLKKINATSYLNHHRKQFLCLQLKADALLAGSDIISAPTPELFLSQGSI